MDKIILIVLFLFVGESIDGQQMFSNAVVAHRGAWKKDKLPENSIAALKEAIDSKCGASEFDIWMTADSVCVVHHDPVFFNLDIEQVNYDDLLKYRLKNGERIPTLDEYFTSGSERNTQTRLVAEIKPSRISGERGKLVANAVMKLVTKHQIQNRVDYISFDIGILQELLRLNPNINTQYLNGELSPAELKKMGVNGIDYHFKVYYNKPQWIDEAKRLNMKLNVWTVNNGKDMDFFIKQDFDYITTNEPEKLNDRISKHHKSKWRLIWKDEFSKEGLPDSTKWSYDVGGHGWGNNEKQYYLAHSVENAFIKNGCLNIVALKKNHKESNYTSAKLTTYQKQEIQYGKVEVRAKLPRGKGNWPAIWMLPVNIKTQAEPWPLCGEIDIMEHVGKDPNVVHTSLHSELYNHMRGTQITHFDTINKVFDEFHTYGIEWDESGIRFIFDEKVYFQTYKGQDGRITSNEGWPFDKPYFLILNLAIGGNWGGEVDDSIFPNVFQVDYVRIYKQK